MAIGRLSAQAGGGVALRVEIDQQRLGADRASAAARFKAVVVLPTPPF